MNLINLIPYLRNYLKKRNEKKYHYKRYFPLEKFNILNRSYIGERKQLLRFLKDSKLFIPEIVNLIDSNFRYEHMIEITMPGGVNTITFFSTDIRRAIINLIEKGKISQGVFILNYYAYIVAYYKINFDLFLRMSVSGYKYLDYFYDTPKYVLEILIHSGLFTNRVYPSRLNLIYRDGIPIIIKQ